MDQGVVTAQQAADALIKAESLQSVLGAVCVLLGLALLGVVVASFWIIRAKDKDKDELYDRLIASELRHQTDLVAANNTRASEIATLQQAINLVSTRGASHVV